MKLSYTKIGKLIPLALLFLLCLGIFFIISNTKAFQSVEQWSFDLRQIAFAPPTTAADNLVMIWLDEKTMQDLPFRSPVPRGFLAGLNDQLLKAQPKIIAYDIFLKDPSFERDDQALAASLKKGPTYAVMPMRLGDCPSDLKNQADGCADLPLPLFQDSLQGLGLADLPFNPFDSIVRRTRLSFDTDLGATPSFAALLYEKATGEKAEDTLSDKSLWPHVGPFTLTPFTGADGDIFIRFAGAPSTIGAKTNTFKVFAAHLAAKGLIPASWLKDKIILVGAAYQDLEDSYLTPYYARFTNYARMNGVEIHTNILSSFLTRQFYFTLQPWQFWTLILFAIFASLIFAALCPPYKSAITLSASIVVYLAVTAIGFKKMGIVLPVLAPVSAGVISYGVGISWRALTEGKQRRWIKGVFSQYVPAAVVDQLIGNPALVKLGGEQRPVTSFFSDIASFTSISENLSPPELVRFLNEYLTLMNNILFRYGGTIDKYEGDAIVAFFNAPLEVKNHETAAAISALEVELASQKISQKWEAQFGRPIHTRIGINTGPAVVGNVGSQTRFDYTAIGDTINLASRLEGTNKYYGTKIMASQTTIHALDKSIVVRPVDRVRVKGKEQAIVIFEIMGRSFNGQPAALIELSQLFTEAFSKFEKRALDETVQLLQEIQNNYPEDGPTRELLKKCAQARENPDWDLITELSVK